MVELASVLAQIAEPEIFVTNDRILVMDEDVVKADVELQLRRSTIVASFLENQPPEFLQMLLG